MGQVRADRRSSRSGPSRVSSSRGPRPGPVDEGKDQVKTRRSGIGRSLRRLEWIGAGAALFVFSGAIFPLMVSGADGMLDPSERGRLRLLNLLAYAVILGLLALRPVAFIRALTRNLPMLALVALTFASTFWSISQSVTMRRAIGLLLSMALAYLLATRFTPRQQIQLIGTVLGVATGLSLLAAGAMPGKAFLPGESELRGVFIHKNVLGWIASFCVLIGIVAQSDASRRMRVGGRVLIVTGLAATLASGSATGLLSVVTAFVTVATVRTLARKRGAARLFAKMVILLASIAALSALIIGLIPLLEFLGKDATLTGRVPLWELVVPEIERRPVLGHGYGAFWSEASPAAWRIWEAEGWQAPHAHEGYLDLLLGIGVVGLALFAVVAWLAIARGVHLCSVAPDEGWAWCVAAVVGALVMNLSESTILMQNDILWVLFSTAALTISMRHAELVQPLPRHVRLAHAAV
ncbi:O-antigen ligase family protein [Salipiger bermudensis]|nr:O-antigen ligase family protein [Salipiger bermudensis]